ncbi:chromate transporter [Cyanobium sp. HWJ4-Hawea]|uniref:chromate transporter n=1 Tax=Cyanobium sp. HWJ4-Hawea TaxID=2823713 RepID=UPI0020CE8C2C|nr:chromate transporter [Cyanobium sp. HWJ4-Hawea]MCP9808771.1 chromate transporter [Cyanobium sp. HWJ4-Hawea]
MSDELVKAPSLRELFWGMLQVALSAFGGGLSAWSQRIVVEQKRWMNDEQFLAGLTVARLFPGPNQINMAVYIGASFRGLSGAMAALAGMLLVPFSFLMLLGLAYFYLHELASFTAVLAGVVAAAAGMALSMGFKIAGHYLRDKVAMVLAVGVFVAMYFFHLRLIPVVLISGTLAMLWYWPREHKS